jgi:hypothetical protein
VSYARKSKIRRLANFGLAGCYGRRLLRCAKEALLFEKRNKAFVNGRTRCGGVYAKKAKVFWFFFSKKNCFLTPPAAKP